jgi:hypothetical protein
MMHDMIGKASIEFGVQGLPCRNLFGAHGRCPAVCGRDQRVLAVFGKQRQ